MSIAKNTRFPRKVCLILVMVVTFGLVATLFTGLATAGDHNHNEHHNENNTETQTGMDNNDNGQCTLNQEREQSRPTVRGS